MTRVYYFTRTGDSKKIADSIASQTGGKCFAVTDGKNWSGLFGFIRGGFYAVRKKSLPAVYDKPQDGDAVYLCFPVWAENFPPVVRTFINEVGRGKITAVPSSMSSKLQDRGGFLKIIDAVGPDKTVKV